MIDIFAIIGAFIGMWAAFVSLAYALSHLFKSDGWGIAAALSVLFAFFSYLFVCMIR